MNRLEGKTALVSGGGSGIGRAIARRFAADGAQVLIVGRTEEPLRRTAESGGINYVVGDITQERTVEEIFETVRDKYGRLDILVNNAGWCPVQPVTELTIEDFDRAFNLDVRALVNMTIHALPLIRASHGSIINMSSVGVTHRAANLSMYQGAKAAVENFTRVWALELAGDGVRVNAIAPGAIRTNIWNATGLPEEAARAHEAAIAATIPCGRFGTPDEVANVAAFLASDEAAYVSGSVYAVDGGAGAN